MGHPTPPIHPSVNIVTNWADTSPQVLQILEPRIPVGDDGKDKEDKEEIKHGVETFPDLQLRCSLVLQLR